jgi:hypothetical protein
MDDAVVVRIGPPGRIGICGTEESDEGKLHVRIREEGTG